MIICSVIVIAGFTFSINQWHSYKIKKEKEECNSLDRLNRIENVVKIEDVKKKDLVFFLNCYTKGYTTKEMAEALNTRLKNLKN